LPSGPELSWSERGGQACLRISGVPAGASMALVSSNLIGAVAGLPGYQPLAGRLERDGRDAVFVPRFPFIEQMRYSLLVDGVETTSILRAGPPGSASVRALEIYPSADELPINQLKLYVEFSGPMSEGYASRAVRVQRLDTGEPLDGVLLEMQPELWDSERHRLTLLLEPGRIKRGLAPNLEAGYPLVEGIAVEVVVDREFRDAHGQPLLEGAHRRYEVGPAVRTRVDPAAWSLTQPRAGSSDPLTVEFDRPLDRALLARCVHVRDRDRERARVAGRLTIARGERSCGFTPRSPWQAGAHSLWVDARLEDLAGNSLRRVFDRDLTQVADTPLAIEHAEVVFCAV
jgi:hypothetical protein